MAHARREENPAEEAEFNALIQEYKAYIGGLKRAWMRENNNRPTRHVLYELDHEEQRRVDNVIKRWEEYITPLAEAWLKKRGYGIRWPEKSSDPCEYFKLEPVLTPS